ncbi:MAG: hypothetical protein AAF676_11180, partial [Pseudomonadota bacterium]
ADFLGGIRQPALAAPLVVTPIVVAIVLLRPARRSLAYKVGSALLVSGALLQVVPIIDTGHRALISVGDAQFSIPWRYEPSPTSGFNVEVFGPELATSRSAIGSGRRDGIHIDVTPSEDWGAGFVEGFGCETTDHTFNCHWTYRDAYILTRSSSENAPADEAAFKRSVEALLDGFRVEAAG